ncbi:MAG: tetratricopeptide (TPR) repeat protein [Vicingaceae bacterium]|jgi:tetratricopeptide (TPR) repeat protein
MNKALSLILFFLLMASGINSWSQNNDIRTLKALTQQAKNNGQNQKAITYYEELIKKSDASQFYSALLELYLTEEEFSAAEKLVKKRMRLLPSNAELLVDKGYIFDVQKQEKDAEKYYKKAVNASLSDNRQGRDVANQFNKYKLYTYSEEVYLKSRKAYKDPRKYQFELANTYSRLGKTDEMVQEYLTILGGNRSYLQTIQTILSRLLNPDPDGTQNEKLRSILIGRIQKEPKNEVFAEMLIWLYIQDKNFLGAFIQAKALDKKSTEQGKRVYELGLLALSNKELSSAEKSFNYVIELKDSPYFLQAKMKLVEVLKQKVISSKTYTQEDLQNLKQAYESTISDLGKGPLTIPLLRGLAELQGYYLDSIPNGILILNEVIAMDRIKSIDRAEAKIELADLFLLKAEIWEASLLYSQVEKEYKYDQLGEIAKFKNAKVAYYIGDFYWAQAQLDVLKGSTSKLISNDAMDLSLLITDNVGLDSIVEPLEMFAIADFMIVRNDFEKATLILDSIVKYFPATSLKDDILFTKHQMAMKERNYEKAAGFLRELISSYGEDLLGDNALIALAKLEEEEFGNKEKAMELYKSLLATYPSSLFVVEARKRFRALRGDKLEEEIN